MCSGSGLSLGTGKVENMVEVVSVVEFGRTGGVVGGAGRGVGRRGGHASERPHVAGVLVLRLSRTRLVRSEHKVAHCSRRSEIYPLNSYLASDANLRFSSLTSRSS
ncbi:hypothetical protein HYQ46_011788 [Verticillium longisporum]|nr:hypothetical protein HYQ46_011788 [Verticillium longisporum]